MNAVEICRANATESQSVREKNRASMPQVARWIDGLSELGFEPQVIRASENGAAFDRQRGELRAYPALYAPMLAKAARR
jgi:hypothetical protein